MPNRSSLGLTRVVYVALAVGTIALGLLVHLRGDALGATSRDVAGDAIWAAMIAWWVAAIAPHLSLRARSVLAVAICFAVEVSQLYHTAALDALRATTIGRLTLGADFDPRDLVAYVGGVLAAAVGEWVWRVLRGRRSRRATFDRSASRSSR
jgi:hypothetical protein